MSHTQYREMDNSTHSAIEESTTSHVTVPTANLQIGVSWIVGISVVLIIVVVSVLAVDRLIRKCKQYLFPLQDTGRESTVNVGDSVIEMGSIGQGLETETLDESRSRSADNFNYRPHFSVKIRHERTNVYGCIPHTSQLMMVAQDYYKSATGTADVIPPENVKVIDKNQQAIDRGSNVFTDDWKMGRTTSMLLDSLGEPLLTNLTNNKAIFIHESIGGTGGNLEISGITLRIPRGALNTSTLITLGVVWDEKYVPPLSRKKSLLSPIILCQPCGLKFKIPVTLTIPHCAENVNDDWNITVMKRAGDVRESTAWTQVGFEDFSEKAITASKISLKLNHFTLYTCIGESRENKIAAKSVHLVAFVSQLSQGSLFKPRIYCLNNYKAELQGVERLMGKMAPDSKISETSDLIIHDNEQELVVKLTELLPNDRWKLMGNKSEVLSFEHVWHGLSPHVTFLMKPTDSTVNEIYCDFTCYQRERENLTARLKIAEEKTKSLSPLAPCTEYPEQELINEVIILLDPVKDGDSGDWRDLAEKFGCDMARITWLGTQSSPTRLLIDMWLEENHSFSELSKIMVEINRPDVADEISKRFPGAE